MEVEDCTQAAFLVQFTGDPNKLCHQEHEKEILTTNRTPEAHDVMCSACTQHARWSHMPLRQEWHALVND